MSSIRHCWYRALGFVVITSSMLVAGCNVEPYSLEMSQDLLAEDTLVDFDKADFETHGPAKIWRNKADLDKCGYWQISEDFSSGSYNVHRFQTQLAEGGNIKVCLRQHSGSWDPALTVYGVDGQSIFNGEKSGGSRDFAVLGSTSGKYHKTADLLLRNANQPKAVNLYVTSWKNMDAGLSRSLPRDATYSLAVMHQCPTKPYGDWRDKAVGIEMDCSFLPHQGMRNNTLKSALGKSTEPYGTVVTRGERQYVRGTMSWFGGPTDGLEPGTDKVAITGETSGSLNNPPNPTEWRLNTYPETYFYSAMRFDYAPNGRSFWKDARLLVVNEATGKAVVVRPVDWGPHTRTKKTIDLSPKARDVLGVQTGQNVLVTFAANDTPLGAVK